MGQVRAHYSSQYLPGPSASPLPRLGLLYCYPTLDINEFVEKLFHLFFARRWRDFSLFRGRDPLLDRAPSFSLGGLVLVVGPGYAIQTR